MPPQTFELKLFDTQRTGQLTALLLLGIFGLMMLCIGAGALLKGGLGLGVGLGLFGAGGFFGWQAFQRAAVVPVRCTLSATDLRLEDLRPVSNWSQVLRLSDITTYRYFNFNNTEELRLNRAGFPPLKLRSAGNLATGSSLGPLVAAFESAMDAAPTLADMGSRREKSFFEKPVSTYLLGVFTLVMIALGWLVVSGQRPVRGKMLSIAGFYLVYLAAWRAAAPRRNAP